MESYPEAIHIPNSEGVFPIHEAVYNTDKARLLLDYFPDEVKRKDDAGRTTLHHAVSISSNDCEHIEIIKLLINLYPEAVQITDRRGRLPIHLVTDVDKACLLLDLFPNIKIMKDTLHYT